MNIFSKIGSNLLVTILTLLTVGTATLGITKFLNNTSDVSAQSDISIPNVKSTNNTNQNSVQSFQSTPYVSSSNSNTDTSKTDTPISNNSSLPSNNGHTLLNISSDINYVSQNKREFEDHDEEDD